MIGRRGFLIGVGAAGATALAGGALGASSAFASSGGLSKGDTAILRFLAAAELLETDLWQQYAELGGVNGGNPAYIAALENLDGDMPQYISDNTDDEASHASFLNAYLRSKGEQPVNLDEFRTLPSSKATGARQIGRLTNLQKLNVDTSWYTRYRSTKNPDLGATFPQAVNIMDEPAIPLNDTDTPPGMSQPVPADAPRAAEADAGDREHGRVPLRHDRAGRLEPLHDDEPQGVAASRCCGSSSRIGGIEVNHFAVWHDKAGNAVGPAAGRREGPRDRASPSRISTPRPSAASSSRPT